MNIIELARDVDEYVRNHHENDAWDAADPMAVHFAQAVVRAAKLADWLDDKAEQWKAEGDDSGAFDGHEVAARIRAALEGDKQ